MYHVLCTLLALSFAAVLYYGMAFTTELGFRAAPDPQRNTQHFRTVALSLVAIAGYLAGMYPNPDVHPYYDTLWPAAIGVAVWRWWWMYNPLRPYYRTPA